MRDLAFWSSDRRFGLMIPPRVVQSVIRLCKAASDFETGGVLVGHYSKRLDCAFVTSCSGPPRDSRVGKAWFNRGVKGISGWLQTLWKKQADFYIGEWHFHPGGAPVMSPRDIREMTSISNSQIYRCPEPVLLIIGGRVPDSWKAGAYVFPRSAEFIELNEGCRPERRKSHKCRKTKQD